MGQTLLWTCREQATAALAAEFRPIADALDSAFERIGEVVEYFQKFLVEDFAVARVYTMVVIKGHNPSSKATTLPRVATASRWMAWGKSRVQCSVHCWSALRHSAERDTLCFSARAGSVIRADAATGQTYRSLQMSLPQQNS